MGWRGFCWAQRFPLRQPRWIGIGGEGQPFEEEHCDRKGNDCAVATTREGSEHRIVPRFEALAVLRKGSAIGMPPVATSWVFKRANDAKALLLCMQLTFKSQLPATVSSGNSWVWPSGLDPHRNHESRFVGSVAPGLQKTW